MGRPRTNKIPETLQRVMAALHVSTMPALAEALGVGLARTLNWPKRGGVPEDVLKQVSKMTGRPLEWFTKPEPFGGYAGEGAGPTSLATGGDIPLPTGPLKADRHIPRVTPITFGWGDDKLYLVVPRYEVRASAGPGRGEVGEENRVGEFAFEVAWMRKHLGRAGEGFSSLEVHGDSMQPTLLNGDQIIIDRQIQRVDVSGIYVIGLRGDLLVKRVQRMLDGSLVVKSDNVA